MTLSEEARDRLADLVELQPTKNSELQDRWGLESGSEVHQYLESELKEYYYRDENSYIRATTEANDLVDVEPGMVADDEDDAPSVVRVPTLQRQVFDVVPDPDDRSASVVSVLHSVRDEFGIDPDVDDVRAALQSLKRKGVVEVVYRTVPTFKLAVARDDITVEESG
ncbi:hypothetical protein BG842_11990 [Haladaptatus sp. W1]|uniref:DUF5797 family protein n=1 Tax=Haladaptatus sp. W1 TaxID=1897478 RepID=UPI000849C96C|nr:DUF5797 family protein [Haladaptatus sp. W1]ODR79227.1 hypothetical protein BG842_11990 [Haladaptatus sp. W1]